MNVARLIIMLLLGILLLYPSQGWAFDPADMSSSDEGSSITVMTYSSSHVKDAFLEEGRAINAYLYRIRLSYYPVYTSSGNRAVGHLVHISFPLTHVSDMSPSSAGEMRLVIDRNGNLAPDEQDEVIAKSMIDFAEKRISFSLDTRLNEGANNLFLMGDFPNLMSKAELRIKFNDRLLVVRESGKSDPVAALGAGYDEVWHREGNSPPELSYSAYIKDIKYGVVPRRGRSGDVFTFEVIYNDRDGNIATAVEVWIDLDGDGRFDLHERFAMEPTDSYGSAFNKRYQFRTRIIPQGSGTVTYRFFGHDGNDEAIGEATKAASLVVNMALVIGRAEVSISERVPGERFEVRYSVRYFFDSVKVNWESVKNQDFSPFVFVGSVHKDKREVSLLYDEEILTVWLEVPVNLLEGMRHVRAFALGSLWYDLEKKEEIELSSFTPEAAVSIVGLRASLEALPTRVVTAIGDPLQIRLTIIKMSEAELVSDPEQEITFSPFTIVRPLALSEAKRGNVDILTFTAVIDPLMATAGRTFEIAAYPIDYRKGGGPLRTFKIPATPIATVAILTDEQVKGPPLVFARRTIPSAYYADMEWMVRFSRIIFSVFFSILFVAVIYPPLRFLYMAFRQSVGYQKMVTRMTWVSLIRMAAYEMYPLPDKVVLRLERAFRAYVGYVCHCSAPEAQSVLLWEYIEQKKFFDAATTQMIRRSLELFRRASEGRANDQESVDLVVLQQKLRRYI